MAETEFTFEAVRERFDQSIHALATLKQRLETLGEAEEHQAQVSESILGAATRLQGMTRALAASTAGLETAMTDLRSLAEASARFLEGEELKAARSDVAALKEEVESSLSLVRQGSKALQQQITSGMERLEAAVLTGLQRVEQEALNRTRELESTLRGDSQKVQNRLSSLEEQVSTKLAEAEAARDVSQAQLKGALKRLAVLEEFRQEADKAGPRVLKALAKAGVKVPSA